MPPRYKQLTTENRLLIESPLADGPSLRAVATKVGVHASTSCRERQRGSLPDFKRCLAVIGERARSAGRARAGMARQLGTDARSGYWPLVLPLLRNGWSPQQIAGRLPAMPSSASISHETISRDHLRDAARPIALRTRPAAPQAPRRPSSPLSRLDERATNENANGLTREYLPKDIDSSRVATPRLRHIEIALNTRPRKILRFQTPEEVFSDLTLNEFLGPSAVALQA